MELKRNDQVGDIVTIARAIPPGATPILPVDGVIQLPPGTRLAMGDLVLEITEKDHTGCSKFAARFGKDALKFVNSPEGARLNLRGIYARIIKGGIARVGDTLTKLTHAPSS